jgi:hypothetical protein
MTLAEELAEKYFPTKNVYENSLTPFAGHSLCVLAINAAILAERERCCQAVCANCAEGDPVELRDGIYWHRDGDSCLASAIREKE